MAKFVGRLEGYPNWDELHSQGTDLMEAFQIQDAAWQELRKRSDELSDGEIVGAMLCWGRGDGVASYVVVNDKPLTLAWAPITDNWSVEEPLIRGLTVADVRAMIGQERRHRALFARRGR